MRVISHIGGPAARDLCLLAYAQYMARTAQSEVARRLFEAYVKMEQECWTKQEKLMKASVNQDTCTGCGLCVETCPEVFAMEQGAAQVKCKTVPVADEATCRTAMEDCPVNAISVEA